MVQADGSNLRLGSARLAWIHRQYPVRRWRVGLNCVRLLNRQKLLHSRALLHGERQSLVACQVFISFQHRVIARS